MPTVQPTDEDSVLAAHHANVAAARAAAAARQAATVPTLPSPDHGMDSAQFNDLLLTHESYPDDGYNDASVNGVEVEASDVEGDGNEDSAPKKKARSKAFTSEENLVLSRAWIAVSENAANSTNQTGVTFWASVTVQYQAMVAQANKINERIDGYKPLLDRPEESLRKAWQKRITTSEKFLRRPLEKTLRGF
jgi:hypothetical protein